MNNLKENFEQIDIASAVTFVADFCLYGVGSLILDGYYRRFKFGSGKLWLIWDCITLALILFHIFVDTLGSIMFGTFGSVWCKTALAEVGVSLP